MGSRRGYLTTAQALSDYGVTATDDQISRAEELIDSYVGFQQKAFRRTSDFGQFNALDYVGQPLVFEMRGKATAATANTLTVEGYQQNTVQAGYYTMCDIEIIAGTGAGQIRKITDSTLGGVLTVDSDWTTTPDNTSIYKIWQLAKFPRVQDEFYNSRENPPKYYRTIPEPVRAAVAAQVAFMTEMGGDFFDSDDVLMNMERIGDYQYNQGNSGITRDLIGPKAKRFLKGYVNRKGKMVTNT